MTARPLPAPLAGLIAEHGLPPGYLDVVRQYWRPLARQIAQRRHDRQGPVIIGVNGAQGSGKSTLCDILVRSLLPEAGLRAATLSLDDLYLTRAQRIELAQHTHPLFLTRGAPGTHDVALGRSILEAVLSGASGQIRLPRFDKARDDRLAPDQWDELALPVDVLLFEGWCLGARAEDDSSLAEPINDLERHEDADGRWRRRVNAELAAVYPALFESIDLLVMLQPPSFDAVIANRALQERKLAARKGQAMDSAALARFMQHYERLTRHMFAEMPDRADIWIGLGDDQCPVTAKYRTGSASARRAADRP